MNKKSIVLLILILCAALATVWVLKFSNEENNTAIQSSITQNKFRIEGLSCQLNSSFVQKKIVKLKGIKKTYVSFDSGYALVTYDSLIVTKIEIEDAINKTPYKVVH